MKQLLYALVLALIFISCGSGDTEISTDLINNSLSASGEASESGMPKMVFREESHDFGTISQGEKVEYSFIFDNKGDADLIISSAVGSCGCTVPSYPKEPIKAGSKGEIKVIFDSNGKKGAQHKRVTIVANTNPNKTLVAIMANVLVPDESNEK